MRSLVMLASLFLPLACSSVRTGDAARADVRSSQARTDAHPAPEPGVAAAQFERIKSLAGAWSGTFGEGESAGAGETRFRLTAAGSAVEEVLFPGTSHEMLTMYHLDGDRLVLTHYCSAGNQPRMVARSTAADRDATTIRFDFDGASNLASPDAGHMHDAEITIEKDRLRTAWTFFEGGKPAEKAKFDLTRKSEP